MAYSGKYKPRNPGKYQGNSNNIVWRSTWELRLMKYMDEDPSVLTWGSEELVVPYLHPDGRVHRYFPDFHVTIRERNGNILKLIVEVKPCLQCKLPVGKRNTKHLREQVNTYNINQAKWAAAREFCKKIVAEFRVVTEDDLFKKPGK
jgi:hypothetical protein